jgi:hypothetical protein
LLLFRGICALLSFDAWTLMIEHGGRYGVGAFNVAHFDILDRLVPLPSPGLYLALVTGAGLFAFAGMLGLLGRFESLMLWALYTLSWMLSMHDSYQHHYLLSWLLGFGIFAAPLSVDQCVEPGARVRESGFPLALGCCAIVYFFTALSKSSSIWLSGAVLRKLGDEGGPMTWVPASLMRMGIGANVAWHLAALSTVAIQIVIALGFVAAFFRDACGGRVLAFLCTSALLAATSFHVATELTPSFAIGWFSYYMLWAVWVSLLPAAWLAEALASLTRGFSRADPVLARARKGWPWVSSSPHFGGLGAVVSLAASLIFLAREELPGVATAALLFSCVLLVRARLVRPEQPARSVTLAFLPGLAIVALALTLDIANVRFDYYRRIAGELSRMGRAEDALELYRAAERHAPSGQSRRAKIEALERLVSEPGEPDP